MAGIAVRFDEPNAFFGENRKERRWHRQSRVSVERALLDPFCMI